MKTNILFKFTYIPPFPEYIINIRFSENSRNDDTGRILDTDDESWN